MPLSNEVKCRLEEAINWPRINVAMLQLLFIENIENAFICFIVIGLDY